MRENQNFIMINRRPMKWMNNITSKIAKLKHNKNQLGNNHLIMFIILPIKKTVLRTKRKATLIVVKEILRIIIKLTMKEKVERGKIKTVHRAALRMINIMISIMLEGRSSMKQLIMVSQMDRAVYIPKLKPNQNSIAKTRTIIMRLYKLRKKNHRYRIMLF